MLGTLHWLMSQVRFMLMRFYLSQSTILQSLMRLNSF
jgi:hypothetical protein